jgi:hypothetical protein
MELFRLITRGVDGNISTKFILGINAYWMPTLDCSWEYWTAIILCVFIAGKQYLGIVD